MNAEKRVNVIGGGFSGLIQAFYFAEAGIPTRLIEKDSRLGGLLGTHQQGEFLFEQAANAFIANKEIERVGRTIGVRWVSKQPAAKKRYIFRDGQMRRWPFGFSESLPLIRFVFSKKWKNKKFSPNPDESLEQWGRIQLSDVLTEYLLEPAIQGVYASRLESLDARLVLDSIAHRRPKGQLRGSIAPLGGMQEWIDKMQAYLLGKGVDLVLSKDFKVEDCSDPTILAVDLRTLKNWVNEQKLDLPKSILETQSVSLTSVSLGFKSPKYRLQEGFGCLFPRSEGFHSLGVLFNHSIFPDRVEKGSSETWILNDQKMEFSNMSPSALLRYVQSDRSLLQRYEKQPDAVKVSQWPQRIPLYNAALRNFLEDYQRQKPPYLLVGNYLGDLGLSKIIFHAQENLRRFQGGYFA